MSDETATTARDWLVGFACELGTQAPDAEAVEHLLALAGVAAHDSERIAAPIACWMAAQAGIAPKEALRRARAYAAQRPR